MSRIKTKSGARVMAAAERAAAAKREWSVAA